MITNSKHEREIESVIELIIGVDKDIGIRDRAEESNRKINFISKDDLMKRFTI